MKKKVKKRVADFNAALGCFRKIMHDDVLYIERRGRPWTFKQARALLDQPNKLSCTFTLLSIKLRPDGQCTEERKKVTLRWVLDGEGLELEY